MAAPYFLNEEELLDLIFAELPSGPFPVDRADDPNENKRSASSSELRAHANILAGLYFNLYLIYSDKFISTVTDDSLPLWEKDYFSEAVDQGLPRIVRIQNLLSKYRAIGSISLPAIQALVAGILGPVGLTFAILPYSGQGNGEETGAWILEKSALDMGTYLGLMDPLLGAGRDLGIVALDCDLDYAAAGLTAQELADIQETAYKYEVAIYGHADASTLALLDKKLTQNEPARSDHFVRNDASPPLDPDDTDLAQFSENTNTVATVVDRLAVAYSEV